MMTRTVSLGFVLALTACLAACAAPTSPDSAPIGESGAGGDEGGAAGAASATGGAGGHGASGGGGAGSAPCGTSPDEQAATLACNLDPGKWCIDQITGGPLCVLGTCAPSTWECAVVAGFTCCRP